MLLLKKISLYDVEQEIYSKRQTIRYDIRDLTVESIVNKYEDSLESDDTELAKKKFNYIYIPEYQRDFTWDEDRQSKLIESIILGLPIPFIFVAENKDSSWEIVDGSQRIRTLHSFITNKLCLKNLKSISSLNGYRFCELEESRQGKILNTALRIIVLSEETTEEAKKDMFERINRGSDLLKPMEKRKGIYTGSFCSFIYDYCRSSDTFQELVKVDKWLVNRQEREELLLRFFAITDSKSYKTGINIGVSSFLDDYLCRMNAEWSNYSEEELSIAVKEYTKRIDKVNDYVQKNFPYGYRHKANPQTKRSVFEAISVGVWLAINEETALTDLDKGTIQKVLSSKEFKQYTHSANETHRKQNLQGRIQTIYQLVTQTSRKINDINI